MIIFENEPDFKADFDLIETAESVTCEVLKQEGCPYQCEINLCLTDNAGIKEINKEYRGIDSETDVLSFPACDFEEPANYDFLDEEDFTYFNPENGNLILGDIMISVERLTAQAEEYGHSIRREYAFLIAHSMLHLLGYDHMNEKEAEIMFSKQEQALTNLKITRED